MPAPKKPTYGELSNIKTKLEMAEKVAKSRFPKDSVKVTNKMPDGKKATLKDVNKQLNKMNPKPKSIKDVAVPVKGMSKTTSTAKAKATPKATAKPKPMTEAQKQAKAMDKLMAKRRAESKKTGSWPNYNTN
jgi:uncharacterized protein YoxC